MSMDPQLQNLHPKGGEKPGWLGEQRNTNKIIAAIIVVSAVLFAADGFYHKHPYFDAESVFGFYAIFGFVMCLAIVLVAKCVRGVLMRDEDYYDHDR